MKAQHGDGGGAASILLPCQKMPMRTRSRSSPATRYSLGVWGFALAAIVSAIVVLTGLTGATDAATAAVAAPLGVVCARSAWRWRRAGAALTDETLVMHGLWRSRAFSRADVTGVRVEPIRKSIMRSFYTGELLVSHEVVLQVGGQPIHLTGLGMSFTSADSAAQFADAVRRALRKPPG